MPQIDVTIDGRKKATGIYRCTSNVHEDAWHFLYNCLQDFIKSTDSRYFRCVIGNQEYVIKKPSYFGNLYSFTYTCNQDNVTQSKVKELNLWDEFEKSVFPVPDLHSWRNAHHELAGQKITVYKLKHLEEILNHIIESNAARNTPTDVKDLHSAYPEESCGIVLFLSSDKEHLTIYENRPGVYSVLLSLITGSKWITDIEQSQLYYTISSAVTNVLLGYNRDEIASLLCKHQIDTIENLTTFATIYVDNGLSVPLEVQCIDSAHHLRMFRTGEKYSIKLLEKTKVLSELVGIDRNIFIDAAVSLFNETFIEKRPTGRKVTTSRGKVRHTRNDSNHSAKAILPLHARMSSYANGVFAKKIASLKDMVCDTLANGTSHDWYSRFARYYIHRSVYDDKLIDVDIFGLNIPRVNSITKASSVDDIVDAIIRDDLIYDMPLNDFERITLEKCDGEVWRVKRNILCSSSFGDIFADSTLGQKEGVIYAFVSDYKRSEFVRSVLVFPPYCVSVYRDADLYKDRCLIEFYRGNGATIESTTSSMDNLYDAVLDLVMSLHIPNKDCGTNIAARVKKCTELRVNLSEMDIGTCFSSIRSELKAAKEENRRICIIRGMHEVAVEKYGDEYMLTITTEEGIDTDMVSEDRLVEFIIEQIE